MYDPKTFMDAVTRHFAGDGGYYCHGQMDWQYYQDNWWLVNMKYENGSGSGFVKLNSHYMEGKWFASYKRGPISKEIILVEMNPMAVAAILAF